MFLYLFRISLILLSALDWNGCKRLLAAEQTFQNSSRSQPKSGKYRVSLAMLTTSPCREDFYFPLSGCFYIVVLYSLCLSLMLMKSTLTFPSGMHHQGGNILFDLRFWVENSVHNQVNWDYAGIFSSINDFTFVSSKDFWYALVQLFFLLFCFILLSPLQRIFI